MVPGVKHVLVCNVVEPKQNHATSFCQQQQHHDSYVKGLHGLLLGLLFAQNFQKEEL